MAVNYDLDMLAAPLGLGAYDIEGAPDGFETAGVFIGAIVTSASGKRYQGCRGFNDMDDGRSKIYPYNRLDTGSLKEHAPVLWAEILAPGSSEPFEGSRDENSYTYTTPTARFSVGVDGWEWSDFNGKWDLKVRRIGNPYMITIPKQLDFNSAQLHRGELGFVEGFVDGEPVKGITFLMYTFGEKGTGYKLVHLPLINKMNHGWFIWGVEYEDGEIVMGEGRRGKPGTGWQMSYLYKDGQSKLTKFPKVEMTHAPNGPVNGFTIEMEELTVKATTDACSVWPHVVFGDIDSTSDPRPIKSSWSNLEWYPKNYKELIERLMNRTITKEAMSTATIVDERILIPGLLE